MPEALLQRRLQQLKEMGCNSIRTAHNPQLPAFYDLCDRMGLLVMDESFDGWKKKADQDYGGRFFAEWWQHDVTDWIRRDRNHPCVIFWSIGNETGEKDIHGITELIHSLDTSRPVTGGDVHEGVDVAGFNGRSVPNDKALERFRRDNPRRPIVVTEEPHTFQTRGFYRTVTEVFKSIDRLPDYQKPEVFSGGHSAYRSSYDNCGRRLVVRTCWHSPPRARGSSASIVGPASITSASRPGRARNRWREFQLRRARSRRIPQGRLLPLPKPLDR